ncbi:hypothetical protein D0Z03_002654 [Geotrichum reessii]|nr:hypothetical protein D0Z03_002654 [Galactomyces reessii]
MEQPDPLSFSNHFWGKQENGVNVLLTHFNNTKHTAEEIKAFYKERAAIEEDYAKRLVALSRKSLGAHEVGTLKTALDDIRLTTEALGKTHSNAANQFKVELDDPLTAFNGTLRTRRKAIHQLMEKLTKAKVSQQQAVDRAREKYEADCLKLNGYSAQQNLLMGKELERNNQKLEKVMISIENNKRDYQNSLRSLAEITERWTSEWKVSCDKLQDLEEERVGFFKTNLWGYTNIVSTVCVSDDEGCENIRVALEKCDVNSDFEALINARGTGSEIMDPPEFIDYAHGETHDKPKTFNIAQFTRVSSLTDAAHDSGYDPSASVMLRTSVSLAKSSSAASIMSQSTDARTVLINRQAPTLQSVAEQTFRPPQQQQSQQHQQQHSDLASSTFGVVPSFNHPQESSNYQISPQPSPMQDEMSRQPSVYSASSADDNEHVQVNPYNIQPPKPAETPMQQKPQQPPHESEQQLSASVQQEEPPRRTWASPLRARASRMDISSSGSKPRATDNERSNTGRFGSPLSANNESTSRIGTGSTASTRQVLTMGDNMFDLGVSTKKSPFDSRPKSASPLKSFAKDDPLVMALERLKSTSTSGAVDSQESEDLPPPNPSPNPQPNDFSRSPSPNPMMQQQQQQPDYRRSMSPNPQAGEFSRSVSPAPFHQQQQRPGSSMDLNRNRSVSPNPYAAPPRANSTASAYGPPQSQQQLPTTTRDGQPVKIYGRAMYDYRAAIPEELSFRAGEIMLVTKMLDDGWWVCETLTDGRTGYVPSNFLKAMNG